MCSVTLEISLDVIHTTNVLNTFTETLHIKYNNIPLCFIGWFYVVIGDGDFEVVVLVVIAWLVLLEALFPFCL